MSDEEFERVWNAAPTLSHVAKAVGTCRATACNRAARLRHVGRRLKRFPRGRAAHRAQAPEASEPQVPQRFRHLTPAQLKEEARYMRSLRERIRQAEVIAGVRKGWTW